VLKKDYHRTGYQMDIKNAKRSNFMGAIGQKKAAISKARKNQSIRLLGGHNFSGQWPNLSKIGYKRAKGSRQKKKKTEKKRVQVLLRTYVGVSRGDKVRRGGQTKREKKTKFSEWKTQQVK